MIKGKRVRESGTSYSLYETAVGWGAAVSGANGLLEVVLPFESNEKEGLRWRMVGLYPGSAEAAEGSVADKAARRLAGYFAGEKVSFDDLPLDVGCFSPFQQEVYRVVASIPPGSVATYASVAAAVGRPRAARGIGQAMGRNPLPIIIPCHRVVGTSGAMTGYSAPGGVASKQWLLRLEGAEVKPGKC